MDTNAVRFDVAENLQTGDHLGSVDFADLFDDQRVQLTKIFASRGHAPGRQVGGDVAHVEQEPRAGAFGNGVSQRFGRPTALDADDADTKFRFSQVGRLPE